MGIHLLKNIKNKYKKFTVLPFYILYLILNQNVTFEHWVPKVAAKFTNSKLIANYQPIMAFKFFLVYLGSLLACSIFLFAIVKNFATGFSGSGKKPVVYGSLSSVIASLAAYGSTFVSNNLFTVFWVLFGLFLLFGLVHVAYVHKKYFSSPVNNTKIFLGELFFALSIVLFTILVFSSLQYFLQHNGRQFLFYPMMLSTFAFFVPVLVMHTFQSAYNIPAPVYNVWKYPVDDPINLPEDDPREKLFVIGFEISKKPNDKRTYFRAKAPEGIYLGDLFYFFLNDYNELQSETQIQFVNEQYEAYEWIFRLKTKWYQGQRVLDPSLTVKDNGIKENSIIICDRV